MRLTHKITHKSASLLGLATLATFAPTAHAAVTSIDAFRVTQYTQTGPATESGPLYFFAARIFEAHPGDITSASLTYPGPGSPAGFSDAGTYFLDQTGFYSTAAAFNAAFPTGAYTDNWSGGTAGAGTASIADTGDFYSNSPLLSAATYADLTTAPGPNAAAPTLLSWDPYVPNASNTVNENDIFVTITDAATNAVLYSSGALSSSALAALVPANTLAPATSYDLEVDFSSRINAASGTIPTTQGFDQRVELPFQTAPRTAAVPEPSSFALLASGLLLGLVPVGLLARRRRRSA